MKDHQSRHKGIPLSWRGLKRRLPSTLTTFQITIITGFLSLLILRSTIGIGNFASYDNSLTTRYTRDDLSKSTWDEDIEPKRNLAQVKRIEKIQKLVGKNDELVEDENIEMMGKSYGKKHENSQKMVAKNDETETENVRTTVEKMDFKEIGLLITETDKSEAKIQQVVQKVEDDLSKDEVKDMDAEPQVLEEEVVENFKDVEAKLAEEESAELKAEFAENSTEESKLAENNHSLTKPEEERKVEVDNDEPETKTEVERNQAETKTEVKRNEAETKTEVDSNEPETKTEIESKEPETKTEVKSTNPDTEEVQSNEPETKIEKQINDSETTSSIKLEGNEPNTASEDAKIQVESNNEPTQTPEEVSKDLRRQAIENMTKLITRNGPNQRLLGPKISDWDLQRAAWLEKNPHMKTAEPHKPKVLLITGSQPLACHSPVGDHYLLKMMKNKIDYCRIHNIEIFHNFALLEKSLSHYWAKLPIIRKMMLMRPEVEWIFWMDSDAMFTDMVFEIPFEKYDDYNLVMWGYDSGVYEERSWVACNSGVMLLRNSQWTLDLLDMWAPMGPEGEIRNEAGKILTSYLTYRPDMMADDQSALVYLMITQEELRPKIHLEWNYALSGYWAVIVDKYEEFAEKSHPGVGGDQWPFTTHFTGCQPCSGMANPMYEGNSCLDGMERAFNFADNQVLRAFGFEHEFLNGATVKRIRNETTQPLLTVPTNNPWAIGSFYEV